VRRIKLARCREGKTLILTIFEKPATTDAIVSRFNVEVIHRFHLHLYGSPSLAFLRSACWLLRSVLLVAQRELERKMDEHQEHTDDLSLGDLLRAVCDRDVVDGE
jgi:hypothetical protein